MPAYYLSKYGDPMTLLCYQGSVPKVLLYRYFRGGLSTEDTGPMRTLYVTREMQAEENAKPGINVEDTAGLQSTWMAMKVYRAHGWQ